MSGSVDQKKYSMRNRVRSKDVDPLRCRRCRLHTDLCACDLLVPLPVSTQLLLISHWAEARKPTNTGQLALACLAGARSCVRGREHIPNDPVTWDPGTTPLLLFPTPDAIALDGWRATHGEAPVTLIVPDGTWRQAKRIPRRVPELRDVQAVKLVGKQASGYRLRRASWDEQLATMEAIAMALGVLEGAAVEARMKHVFRAVVERALWSNGRVATAEVTGGVPPGARQDGPRPHDGTKPAGQMPPATLVG
jgi:DTW domain-containing protein YfiP